jgi:hypothetical protein
MAALPDQTENVPLLNMTAEQHSDNLTPESSQQNRNDLGTFEGKRLKDTFQPLFPDETFWSAASIVGGFVIAGELTIAHYAFLHYLHGRNINEYPQVWIKGANNGFSNIFSIFVALSAGTALTQIVRLPSCSHVWPLISMPVVEMASFRQQAFANAHHRYPIRTSGTARLT